MTEQLKPPFPERLGIEQNLFDQQSFDKITEIGSIYESPEHIYAATFITAKGFIRTLSHRQLPEDMLLEQLFQDEDKIRIGFYHMLKMKDYHKPIRNKLRDLPAFQSSEAKDVFVSDLLASIVGNLDEPLLQMLYLAEHRNLYESYGRPTLGKTLPEHAPLIYEKWKEKRLKREQVESEYKYVGLEEILAELEYTRVPTSPEGGKRPVNRYWRTLDSTETNNPKKND